MLQTKDDETKDSAAFLKQGRPWKAKATAWGSRSVCEATLSSVSVCVSFQAHTVPVTAHWWPAQHRDEAGQRAKVQEGAAERSVESEWQFSPAPHRLDTSQTMWSWLVLVFMLLFFVVNVGSMMIAEILINSGASKLYIIEKFFINFCIWVNNSILERKPLFFFIFYNETSTALMKLSNAVCAHVCVRVQIELL